MTPGVCSGCPLRTGAAGGRCRAAITAQCDQGPHVSDADLRRSAPAAARGAAIAKASNKDRLHSIGRDEAMSKTTKHSRLSDARMALPEAMEPRDRRARARSKSVALAARGENSFRFNKNCTCKDLRIDYDHGKLTCLVKEDSTQRMEANDDLFRRALRR